MESPTWTLLAANATLTALVPASRIRKAWAGDSPATPYIVIEEVTATPESYTGNRPGIDNYRATVKVVADDTAECRQIAAIVRDTLETEATCLFTDGPSFESDTLLYMHLSDWSHWTRR